MSTKSVLIVDSDAAFRRRLAGFFEFARIQALGVGSFEAALTFLRAIPTGGLDAVVVCVDDVEPWQITLLRTESKQIPMLLTGYPPLAHGELDCLVKPFPPERLVGRVKRKVCRSAAPGVDSDVVPA